MQAASSVNDPNIEIYDAGYADDFWAQNSGDCEIFGSDWSGNEVVQRYNTRTTTGLSATNKAYVVVHELGHAYGLAHRSMTCSTGRSVMEQGEEKFSCAGSPPWADDQNGVIEKY